MAYDLGDVATLAINIKDSAGAAANAGAVVATVTAPDGTTSTPSVVNSPTGTYTVTYTPTLVGRHSIRWVATGANAGSFTDVFDVLDPALLPIVSLADLKAHLRDTATATAASDDLYRYTLAQATDIAERYCNRALRRKTVVETHDGGKPALLLRETPVLSVTTVVENAVTLASTAYTINLNSGVLYRGTNTSVGYYWQGGTQGVVVTYVAGYTDPPLVAQRAVLDIAKWLWQRTQNGPRPGFGQTADADTFGTDALPTWLMRPLASLMMPGSA